MKGAEATELPAASATDSDMETSLIIDEGEKKKPVKRKTLTSTSNTQVSIVSFCFLYRNNASEYYIHVFCEYCAKEQFLTNVLQEKLRDCRQAFFKFK